MKPFVAYKKATGEIIQTGFAPDEALESMKDEETDVLFGSGTTTAHYVDLETLTVTAKISNPARIPMTVIAVGGKVKITNVVKGSIVEVKSPGGVKVAQEEIDDDGLVEWTPEEPGGHQLSIRHISTFPASFILDVQPASVIPEE